MKTLDEELNSDFSNLKNLSFEVKDERVQARVEMAILAYREKKEDPERPQSVPQYHNGR